MTIQTIAQIGIFIFGGASIVLVTRPNPRLARWGPVCGLLSTPFFLYSSITHLQWALTILTLIYALSWASAIYQTWIKLRKEVIHLSENIELIDITPVVGDAVTSDHRSIVTAINQLISNQKAIAEGARVMASDDLTDEEPDSTEGDTPPPPAE